MIRQRTELILSAAAVGAGLFLAWQLAETLLLIFAGVLFGVLLDSLAAALGRFLPIGRGGRLLIVCVLAALLLVGILAWTAYALATEWDELARTLTEQLQRLRAAAGRYGVSAAGGGAGEPSLTELLLPDPARLFGGARSALMAGFGMAGSAILIMLIGIFGAASPQTYRDGLLRLVPAPRRRQAARLLRECVTVLRWWLIGQLVTMSLIGLSVWALLAAFGMPGAMLLGVQAAALNFIPYLGAFLAAVPILLAAASQGFTLVIWAGTAYLIVQSIEGYVLTPLVQRRAVQLPPVVTLGALMALGTLFGAPGIALATPLAAVARVLVLRLWVDETEKQSPAQGGAPRRLRP